MEEYKHRASQQGWDVFNITPDCLWETTKLKKAIGQEWFLQWKSLGAKVGHGGVGVDSEFDIKQKSVMEILNTGTSPLLLSLDEAQGLKSLLAYDCLIIQEATDVLDKIHNSGFQRPVILLLGGLSHTQSILQDFRISRFASKCAVRLDALSPQEEKDLLKDYFVQGAGIEKNSSNDLDDWIARIVKETYGWPHHIVNYGQSAVDIVSKYGGEMSSKALKDLLKQGQSLRYDYYVSRWNEFTPQEKWLLYPFLSSLDPRGFLDHHLTETLEKTCSKKESLDLLDKMLEKGVIHVTPNDTYDVPIPSMVSWIQKQQQQQGYAC